MRPAGRATIPGESVKHAEYNDVAYRLVAYIWMVPVTDVQVLFVN